MSKVLGKQQILQAKDQVIEEVPVPEWGDDETVVLVRSISAAERGMIERDAAAYKETKGKGNNFAQNFTVRLAALAMCDEQGQQLFAADEVDLLRQKNAAVITRISEVAQRLSGFSKGDVEEMEKNSKPTQPGDSVSG